MSLTRLIKNDILAIPAIASELKYFSEMVSKFESALAGKSKKKEGPYSIWADNPLLQGWFSGLPLIFSGADNKKYTILLTFPQVVANFELVLKSKINTASLIIKEIWNKNAVLRTYFEGALLPGYNKISANRLLICFKAILLSGSIAIIKAIWDKNHDLQACVKGKAINFGTDLLPKYSCVSLRSIIDDLFLPALACRDRYIITMMWEANPELRLWFLGHSVYSGRIGEVINKIGDDAIRYFRHILASGIENLIVTIWENNAKLRADIKNSNFEEAKVILSEVLDSSTTGKSLFIDRFLSEVNDGELITAVLAEKRKGQQGVIRALIQIPILEQRLAVLQKHYPASAFPDMEIESIPSSPEYEMDVLEDQSPLVNTGQQSITRYTTLTKLTLFERDPVKIEGMTFKLFTTERDQANNSLDADPIPKKPML